jgi:hypothetical protein
MWNELDETSGMKSETAVKTVWSSMVSDPSSTTFRFLGTRLSAVRILLPSIKIANGKKTSLIFKEIQKVPQHLLVASTRGLLYRDLHSLIARQRELLNTICIELEQVSPNESSLKPLIDEHQDVTAKLWSRLDLAKSLKLPLSKRMLDTLLVVVSWNWFKGFAKNFESIDYKHLIFMQTSPKSVLPRGGDKRRCHYLVSDFLLRGYIY